MGISNCDLIMINERLLTCLCFHVKCLSDLRLFMILAFMLSFGSTIYLFLCPNMLLFLGAGVHDFSMLWYISFLWPSFVVFVMFLFNSCDSYIRKNWWSKDVISYCFETWFQWNWIREIYVYFVVALLCFGLKFVKRW